MYNCDVIHELEVFLAQAKSTRNLDGLKITHIKRAVKEIGRLRIQNFELLQKNEKLFDALLLLRQYLKNEPLEHAVVPQRIAPYSENLSIGEYLDRIIKNRK